MNSSTSSPYQDKADLWSSHAIIRSWLGRFPPGTRVLDIGTATGTVGRMCQNYHLVIEGLEPNSEWAQIAQPYYHKILTVMLEEAPDAFLVGYSVIILADVLEHLQAPEMALKRLVSLQTPGTLFIVSVPNVANVWVRLHLLFGHFNYSERGILDRTHLHFYTHKTFLKLIDAAGLKVRHMEVTTIPLPLLSSFFGKNAAGRFLHRLLATLTQIFPTLLGYQFLAELDKK
jgi:2-polyprenyl-3-methyl-5-hydroxy-6-metoxy-1,4-benzoquinol methylase